MRAVVALIIVWGYLTAPGWAVVVLAIRHGWL